MSKFNVGDELFYVDNNLVKKVKIEGVIDVDVDETMYYAHEFLYLDDEQSEYKLKACNDYIAESRLFESKDEALANE